jgi:hypothetical protein
MNNGTTKRKMMHLWMVEDVPANATREAKSWWTKIGVAFENKDGSYSLELSAIPVNGRLQMREPAPRDREDKGSKDVQPPVYQ